MINDLSVCITNFKRAKYLSRAIESARAAGIKKIIVSATEPDEEVTRVLSEYKDITVSILDDDLGCNQSWLDAAYHCTTDRLIILHDDDVLAPEFGQTYTEEIKPLMDSKQVEFCTWRAHLLFDDGRKQSTEWAGSEKWSRNGTKMYNSGPLRDYLLRQGRLSLSPIISIFDRSTLIGALKESHQYLTPHEECLYHSGMLLGTELIAYLRHCAQFGKWMFVDKVLSYYGCCDSSGTVKAQKTGDLRPLTVGYDVARRHFISGAYSNVKHDPRIIFVYDNVPAKDEDEQRRFDYAMFTWKYHFNQGDVLEYPTNVRQWRRSSADLGDPRPAPYVKDLIDYGISHARPEDVVVYANRDICLTSCAPERITQSVQQNGVAVCWRRNFVPKHGRIYKHSTMAKRDGGMDALAISPKWWSEHRDLMPDMLIGRETWDWVFRTIAEEKHGKSIYVDDCIIHEPHASYWKQNKKTNPGQIYNRSLAKVFFARRRDRRALISLQ